MGRGGEMTDQTVVGGLAAEPRLAASGADVGDFIALLKKDKDIKKHLSAKEIDAAFNLKNHLKNVDRIFKRVFK